MKQAIFFALLFLFTACRSHYMPTQTYAPAQLQKDFGVMRKNLEKAHPSLYWYTPKDSMDRAFDEVAQQLNHSMTERRFRLLLQPLIEKVHCGHTDVYPPKSLEGYRKKHPAHDLPFGIIKEGEKFYVFYNLSNDSTLRVGQEVLSIEGKPIGSIYKMMFDGATTDGHNQTFKQYQAINQFGALYRFYEGEKPEYAIEIKNDKGEVRQLRVKKKVVPKASQVVALPDTSKKIPKKLLKPKFLAGNEQINLKKWERDSTIGILDHNSFRPKKYKKIYAEIFKKIREENIQKLVLDLRANGGGKTSSSANLVSYFAQKPFKMAESVEGKPLGASMGQGMEARIPRLMRFVFFSKKKPNGDRYLAGEYRVYKPEEKYHYKGQLVAITNGGSFSAAAIVAANLQAFGLAKTIGRETGGGRYGLSAWVIPYLTLPHTRIRVRIPLFRVINPVPAPNTGRGVMPNYPVVYTHKDQIAARDLDMAEAARVLNEAK